MRIPISCVGGLLCVLAGAQSSAPVLPAAGTTDARQIHWQRSLADALAIAKAEDRPLLIAINMDGESAAERIVRERYRDLAFVALTRRSVCLAASGFRHSPRDHDDEGRRIPCPRLGQVTCGEHMALEPLLYDRYLAGTERVAPRHVLIRQDGTVAWDLSMIFDLHDLDKELAKVPEPPPRACAPPSDALADLAARRDHFGRTRLERLLLEHEDPETLGPALDALFTHGDAGALEALRVLCGKLPRLTAEVQKRLVEVARALELGGAGAEALRDRVRSLGAAPGGLEPDAAAAALPLLAELDPGSAATRSLLLACRATSLYGEPAVLALGRAFGRETLAAIETALSVRKDVRPLAELLLFARRVTEEGRVKGPLPRPGTISDAMPDADALEQALGDYEARLAKRRDDVDLLAAFAKASLDLGRRKIELQQKGADVLLDDAETYFARALGLKPERADLWIERARTAYFRGHFADQVAYGRCGLQLCPAPLVEDPRAIEALRWVGDGNARLLAERSGQDPVSEISGIVEGAEALGLVAASAYGDATDWVSFGSFYGALGLWREELAILQEGALRLPAAQEIRQRLNASLWNGGRIDLAAAKADKIASQNPDSAEALWFSGHAWLLVAENDRRGERPEQALAAYDHARGAFAQSMTQRPDYEKSSTHYSALSWLGSGMAHLLAGRRAEAAECLAKGIATDAAVAGARDGLDREAIDLVDQVLEWQESGKSPVDPLALLDQLEAADPENPLWAIAVSDSQLREALRADGRNPRRALRDTVDAAGKKIRMPVGLPTEAGDAYLRAAIEAGRRALRHGDSDEVKQTLAQAATIIAERQLERGDLGGAARALADSAPLLGFEVPAAGASEPALRELASQLRAKLGEARPHFRPGR